MTEEIQDGSKVSGVPVYEVCTSLILATEIDHAVKKMDGKCVTKPLMLQTRIKYTAR